VEKSYLGKGKEEFYLMVTAFSSYKRVDLTVESFNRLGFPLKVIGTGQDEKAIKKMAKANIEFLSRRGRMDYKEYYPNARPLSFLEKRTLV
jgi:glycosyltransferase involved in cell wall biosynthesis